MSKSSSSCKYCGHIRIINQENSAKISYESKRNKMKVSQKKRNSKYFKQVIIPECICSDHSDKKD